MYMINVMHITLSMLKNVGLYSYNVDRDNYT